MSAMTPQTPEPLTNMVPGLVSVTFRSLTPTQIVEAVSRAGLKAIEWGGDVHVPHGDVHVAEEVRQLTERAKLHVSSYGSYYRAGSFDPVHTNFTPILDTAVALGAPTIRVWAGRKGSAETPPEQRQIIVDDLRRIADQAAAKAVRIALEYHGGTLTDTSESAVDLFRAVDHANLRLYWQPDPRRTHAERRSDLDAVLPYVENVHVFHWTHPAHEVLRHPLVEASDQWRDYFRRFREATVQHLLLEFVPHDLPSLLSTEAATLLHWVEKF